MSAMAAPKAKSPEELLARRTRVSELYIECRSMAEIARQIKVSIETVYRDVCWAREQWRTRAADAIEIHKNRELGRVDHLEVEAWKGWQRSCKYAVTTKEKIGSRTGPQGGDFNETSKVKTKQAGDPRFLQVVKDCIASRRAILGLDAPIQQRIANPDGSPILSGIKVVEVGRPS